MPPFPRLGNGELETREGEIMKKTPPDRSNQSNSRRKRKGKAVASLPQKGRGSSPLSNGKNGSTPRCPKCKGFLVVHHTDLSSVLEIRCVNCGWQPQWGTRTVGVSKEIHSIRNLTTKMFFQPSLRLSIVSENGCLKQQ